MVKNTKKSIHYFFVDEVGDPTFYNRYGKNIVGNEGCSKILMLGFIRTTNPADIRNRISQLQRRTLEDKYLEDIPSIKKTQKAFHAKDDTPEVREKMFKLIKNLEFKAEFIIARKVERIFISDYDKSGNKFYDDLISRLFENKLHISKENIICFSVRGSKSRRIPLESAIQNAIKRFEYKHNKKVETSFKIEPQSPYGEPCLQVIDYMSWALQRAIIRNESRYVKYVINKISFVYDIYDFNNYPKNFYNRRNIFDINKISPI